MKILIEYRNQNPEYDRRTLGSLTRRVAALALKENDAPTDSEISISFIDDEEMRELNAKYRNIDRPTDVLAFPLWEGPENPNTQIPEDSEARKLLGDVVISIPTARAQARRARRTTRREIATLLVHGALHLLSFDHPAGKSKKALATAQAMKEEEKLCLLALEKEMIL